MKRILLLINPKSRTGSDACSKIEKALRESDHVVVSLTEEEKEMDFNDLIVKYKNEIDLVMVGGGDGSVNYVLPALVDTQLPLLVCPLGTANLLAKSFNLSADIKELIKLIEVGHTVSVDVGDVNGIYFINVTGMGISTEVNRQLPEELKKKTGHLSFWLWGLKVIKEMHPFRAKIYVKGQPPVETRTWQITICNGRRYANWMTIKDDATYRDKKLHVLSTEVNRWWKSLFMLYSYLTGKFKDKQDVTLLEGEEIRIETRHKHAIDVDGDIKTTTPAVFRVIPKAIKMVVPELQTPALIK